MESPDTPPHEAARRRRWQLFVAAEAVLLLLATVGSWMALTVPDRGAWAAMLLTVVWMWLVCTLPICVQYLLTGKPVELTLTPLIPSAESRAFRRQLRERVALTDDEFYRQFYAASGIPQDIPVTVRRLFVEHLGGLADRLVPTDNLTFFDGELDLAEPLRWIGPKFGVRFTHDDYPAVDGTLDSFIRATHEKVIRKANG